MIVSKWGNSLAVRLPKSLVDELGLDEGDELAVVKAKPHEIAVAKENSKAAFLASMAKFHWPAAKDYKFNRDDANTR
ncbi:MAG: AbrB/MazE/SpoVT family DNA-binding domain-containing protein [Hyphomicrobiales bacterium]